MRENQQIVYDILSAHPDGMTVVELKNAVNDRKPNLTLKKITDPLQGKGIIVFDEGRFKARAIIEQENNSAAAESNKTKQINIEGKSQIEVDELLQNTNFSLKATFRTARALSDDDALRFYIYTVKTYKALIAKNSASSESADYWGKEYFRHKDWDYVDPMHSLNEEQYTFKSMVCHSQNKNGGVDFRVLGAFCCGYDFHAFLRKSSAVCRTELRGLFQNKTQQGLSNLEKTISSIAKFLSKKPHNKTMPDYINDTFRRLVCRTDNHYRIPGKFKKENLFGFAEALSFDFLKEYFPNPTYNVFDFPKPDLHVKRTLAALFHPDRALMRQFASKPTRLNPDSVETIYKNNSKPNAMGLYLGLMDKVNRAIRARLEVDSPIIGDYILDKMIYLICSGKLYLQGVQDISLKNDYLKGILDDSFKSTPIPTNLLRFLGL